MYWLVTIIVEFTVIIFNFTQLTKTKMKPLLPLLLMLIIVFSCSPTKDYQSHDGLTFKDLDWKDEKLERPFLINSDVSKKLTESEKKLYLPARLFKNSRIDHVYFDGMKSDNVEMIDGEKPRYQIYLNKNDHKVDNIPYNLAPDEAVLQITVFNSSKKIQVVNHEKLIKIADIRVPFYHEDEID
ncbi:MAG: hypothetical protein WBG46_01495 [Nonlabens sp.]